MDTITPAARLGPPAPRHFTPAEREARPARALLDGPPGSGRTLTALRIASGLGTRIAVLDTAHGASLRYADQVKFDVIELSTFGLDELMLALYEAAVTGYDTLVIDGLSPFWSGRSGLLEQVDEAMKKAGPKAAKDAGWTAVRPLERRMMEGILLFPGHLVATVNSRIETVLESDGDRHRLRRYALRSDMRDGFENYVDFAGALDDEHVLTVVKSRDAELDGRQLDWTGKDLGKHLARWAAVGRESTLHRNYYLDAYNRSATRGSLMALQQRLAAAHAKGMAAVSPTGTGMTLGEVVEFRLAQRDHVPDPQPAAVHERPWPTPVAPVPAAPQPRQPGSDGPTSLPQAKELSSDAGPEETALHRVATILREPGAWDNKMAILKARVAAVEGSALELSVLCEDNRFRVVKDLLNDRDHELKPAEESPPTRPD